MARFNKTANTILTMFKVGLATGMIAFVFYWIFVFFNYRPYYLFTYLNQELDGLGVTVAAISFALIFGSVYLLAHTRFKD